MSRSVGETIDQFNEMRGTGGGSIFEKHAADIIRLLQTRSNDQASDDDEGPARIVHVQATIKQTEKTPDSEKAVKQGLMRTPLSEIMAKLSLRIKNLD
jgi:hypothetical protein